MKTEKKEGKKVSMGELEKIRELEGHLAHLKNQVAEMEYQKHLALHRMSVLVGEQNKLKDKLVGKYGDVDINTQTGQILERVKEDKPEPKLQIE